MQEFENPKNLHILRYIHNILYAKGFKIDDLNTHCKENKILSLGISDTSNLCGALEFLKKLLKVELNHNRNPNNF